MTQEAKSKAPKKPRKLKPQAVQISGELHAAMRRLADAEAERTGKPVTLRSIVEDAVYAAHPDLADPEAIAEAERRAAAEAEDQARQMRLDAELEEKAAEAEAPVYAEADPQTDAEVFSAILAAAFGGGCTHSSGTVIGTMGQPILLHELVEFVQGGGFANDLQGLIEAYENAVDEAAAAEEVQQ